MTAVRNNKGITAVEALISVFVTSLVGAALAALLVHSLSGFGSGSSHEASTSQATIALQKLAAEVREAKSATVSGGVLTVTFPLKVQNPATGEYIYDLTGDSPTPRSYYVSNGNLVKNVGGTVSVLARGIKSATFAVSARVIYVTLTSEDQVGRSKASEVVTGRIALRNVKD
ncbi:MAG: hypothetical protein QHI38_08415 [Armatimonadota bacterium]|nr:hypothetical protein [Armatimonadota bacterium]